MSVDKRQHTRSPWREAYEMLIARPQRENTPPESSVTIGTTAKRIHTWEITVRGADAAECQKVARRLDDELSATFAHELDDDTLAGKLAASVTAK